MFVRVKKSGHHQYLQIVSNKRVDGKVRQSVIGTLGRLDRLQETGELDGLLASCARFAEQSAVLSAQRQGTLSPAKTDRIGPALVFDRLWHQLGLPRIFGQLLADRKFEFDVQRAIFLTVLHRLFDPGSDRAAERWRHHYVIDGVESLQLHHLYRAMAWLGEELPDEQQGGRTPFAPRCNKDLVEEALFEERRDLFSEIDLVFFDTTSIYFEGQGGETIGQHGNSKDHRPDLKQMVVGLVIDGEGRPLCCELWPGNTTDVKTLIPIVDRLRERFDIRSLCIVADRGMISKETIESLQAADDDIRFLLGARMRAVKEVREKVLGRGGRYQIVRGPRQRKKDPAPLKVKEVWVKDRRYIVCHNEEEARKEKEAREAIVASLTEQLRKGPVSLVGNKGYRKFLTARKGGALRIDEQKIKEDAGYDGKWVLQTDTDLSPAECALKYKELLLVEQLFRSIKSILETRPIYHQCDQTIRGHVFCSFMALVLIKELWSRLEQRGWCIEWEHLRRDLDALEEITVTTHEKTFVIRSETQGVAGKAIQAAGIALGSIVRFVDSAAPPPGRPPTLGGKANCSANATVPIPKS